MNTLKIAGKFLDQPMLVEKFRKTVPAVLTASAALYSVHEINKAPEKHKNKAAIRTLSTMAFTVGSALAAPKITDKIFKKEMPKSIKTLQKEAGECVSEFLKNNFTDKKSAEILEKAKTKILKYSEIKTLFKKFEYNESGKKLLNKLIPDPENVTSKEIFSEIGRLSLFGLIPVAGGIAGGITGDMLTHNHWKKRVPDKIKEGSYQYLANIFLCNIGAGAALGLMEKCKVTSKAHRALGMIGGILVTGVIGGSAIANLIGNKIITPMFEGKGQHHQHKSLFEERRPEPLDIGLHTDDIATVAVMSGLKWIEPALPIMYSISGYRAGIGYRNGN